MNTKKLKEEEKTAASIYYESAKKSSALPRRKVEYFQLDLQPKSDLRELKHRNSVKPLPTINKKI